MVSLARSITEARSRHNASHELLARMAGCSAKTVVNVESGRTAKPRRSIQIALETAIQRLDVESFGAEQSGQAAVGPSDSPNSAQPCDCSKPSSNGDVPARAPASAQTDSDLEA